MHGQRQRPELGPCRSPDLPFSQRRIAQVEARHAMKAPRMAKWGLRLGLPAGCVIVSMLCGKSLAGAIGVLFLAALLMVFMAVCPFLLIGLVFLPVFQLYGLKIDSKDEPDMDLHNAGTQLFLKIGMAATLALVIALSFSLR
jgi:hypothetical protein